MQVKAKTMGRTSFFVTISAGAFLAVPMLACTEEVIVVSGPRPGASQAVTQPTYSAPALSAPPPGPGACDLKSNGVLFQAPACNVCMQNGCCAQTVACFGPAGGDCNKLYQCIQRCPSHGLPLPTNDAGPAPGFDSGIPGLQTDSGPTPPPQDAAAPEDPCVVQCNSLYPVAASTAKAFIECYAHSCTASCG